MASPEITWPNFNLFRRRAGLWSVLNARHCINNPTTVLILTSVEFSVLMLILPNAAPECDHVWVQQAAIPTHHMF